MDPRVDAAEPRAALDDTVSPEEEGGVSAQGAAARPGSEPPWPPSPHFAPGVWAGGGWRERSMPAGTQTPPGQQVDMRPEARLAILTDLTRQFFVKNKTTV